MRILFITRKYPPSKGGMESLSYHLTTRFLGEKKILAMRARHQIHLVWFVPYVTLYLLCFGWRYDIVHLSDLVIACLGWVAKIVWRKPVAITIHGLDFTYEDGRSILERIYHVYLTLVRAVPPYDHLYSNSQNTKRLAVEHGLGPVTAIPLGVEPPEPSSEVTREDLFALVPPVSSNAFYLLSAGRMVTRKGFSWFLETVFVHLPNHTMFVHAGPVNWRGGDMEPVRIQQLIEAHHWQERVHILGPVSDETLALLFATCDLFVMPNIPVSDDLEGFGIVACEAAWSGMAVIASNLEGIPDAIQDGENGVLLPSQDASAWISAVSRLMSHPDQRAELAKKAKIFTRAHYAWDAVARTYDQEMKKLL